ncbi:MAG: manganese efflux pump [Planctomycetes bacterium]|nr:manganese efflux pump [Planctomycetota bacterium]
MSWSALSAATALGFALAADAFAAALCQGTTARDRHHARALCIGAAFGAAQAIGPLLGWALGVACASLIEAIDHWIAFAILLVLGVRLLRAGLAGGTECGPPARGWLLVGLAVGTSVDAVAAGFALPTLELAPVVTAAIVGAVTFVLSAAGVYLGRAAGAALGGKAEVLGGVVLVAIGVRILFDHGVFR